MKLSAQLFHTQVDRLLKSVFNPEWFTNRLTIRALQTEILRVCCLVVICVNFLIGLLGSWVSYQFYGVVTLVALCVLLLNKRGKYEAARILFTGFIHLSIFFLSAIRTDLLLTYPMLLAGVLICYLLFFDDAQWKLVGNILIMLGIFSIFQVTSYTIPYQVTVTDQLLNRAFIINIGCILASVVLSLMYLMVVYEKSEKNLRRTLVELKHRNQEMDQYVYRVSHDLRAPLCSVTGLVNLAQEEEDLVAVRQYLTMVASTIKKSDNFIQSVLTHSKVLNMELKPVRIDLEQLIGECFNDLSEMPDWQRVELTIKTEASSLFCNDVFRLTTIFHNLLENAIRYQNLEDPKSFIHCDISVNSRQAIIVMADTGIGVERESIRKIFDMFYRGTEKSQGAGLGLYIVKQALDRIGGTVSVESQPDQGTRFTLKLDNLAPSNNFKPKKSEKSAT